MQFDITIIQVAEVKDKKNARGGVFNAVEVVYKREGKVEAKSFPDWANKEIYDTLKGLVKDGNYTVTTEKVGEFWKWLGVVPSTGTPVDKPTATVGVSSSSPKAVTGKVLGSNYETPSERALRQKYIIAQSSISSSIALAAGNKEKVSPETVIATANIFYDFVFSKAGDLSDIKSDEV